MKYKLIEVIAAGWLIIIALSIYQQNKHLEIDDEYWGG